MPRLLTSPGRRKTQISDHQCGGRVRRKLCRAGSRTPARLLPSSAAPSPRSICRARPITSLILGVNPRPSRIFGGRTSDAQEPARLRRGVRGTTAAATTTTAGAAGGCWCPPTSTPMATTTSCGATTMAPSRSGAARRYQQRPLDLQSGRRACRAARRRHRRFRRQRRQRYPLAGRRRRRFRPGDNGRAGDAQTLAGAGVVPAGWRSCREEDRRLRRQRPRRHSLAERQRGGLDLGPTAISTTRTGSPIPARCRRAGTIAGVGDFDGNGHDDRILWQNDNGAVSIWDNGSINIAHWIAESWSRCRRAAAYSSASAISTAAAATISCWQNTNGAASIWDNGNIADAHWISRPEGRCPAPSISSALVTMTATATTTFLWPEPSNTDTLTIWNNGQSATAHAAAAAGVVSRRDWHVV